MTEEATKPPAVTDPALLEKMRACWRKWRDKMLAIQAEGKKLCPKCRSCPIEKERKLCAVCEFEKSGRGVRQGNPASFEKR